MIDRRLEDYGKTLAKMIQKETISVAGQPFDPKFLEFHRLLEELFPKVFGTCCKQCFGGTLLLHWHGKHSDRPVLLMSHHDVVEATGNWRYPPFSGKIAEEKIWGRGTLDTKGNLWAMLQAAEELMTEGFVPEQDIWFESACTEETDGSGAAAVAKWFKEQRIRFAFTLDEGGMIVKDPLGLTENDYAVIGVGEKTFLDLRFVARSRGGHASAPGKNTPLVRLGKFMTAMDNTARFSSRLNAPMAEMLQRVSDDLKDGFLKKVLKNPGKYPAAFGKLLSMISPQAAALVRSTLAFTMAGGSEGTNVLPQEAWVIGNLRVAHHQGVEENLESIRRVAKKYDVEVEIIDRQPDSPISDFHADGFKLAEQAVADVFGGIKCLPYVSSAASDSRFFGNVSDCCLRFAPFTISEEQLDSIHGIDENLDLDTLPKAVDFYHAVIKGVH